jgi:hypothetical protein
VRNLATLLLLLMAAGCASGRGSAEVRRSLGNASATDAFVLTRRVLALHRFEVEHEENTPQLIMLQSRWLRREPFGDERAAGVAEAENRVTMTGRFRLQTEQGPLYAIDLLIERRVVMLGQEGWLDAPPTRAALAHADSVSKQLQRELQLGTRRFE